MSILRKLEVPKGAAPSQVRAIARFNFLVEVLDAFPAEELLPDGGLGADAMDQVVTLALSSLLRDDIVRREPQSSVILEGLSGVLVGMAWKQRQPPAPPAAAAPEPDPPQRDGCDDPSCVACALRRALQASLGQRSPPDQETKH